VAGGPADVKAERATLQGTWQLVAEDMDGNDQPPEYVRQIQFTFGAQGDWRVDKGREVLFQGTAQNPKEVERSVSSRIDRPTWPVVLNAFS
jgi:hypothetical protein